jgi:thymidylate kinase
MARIRRLVRSRCGAPFHSALADAVVNRLRAWRYFASRVANRLAPGHIIDRRRPAGGGLVVAVMAPDGLGKSTQVDRMYRLFNWKFSCAKLYLGTGDGQGWWLRRRIRSMYMRRRSRIDMALGERTSRPGSAGFKSAMTAFLLSAWGVLVALERHGRVRAARRMADRGFIVFCDRWPQSLQAGLMDGPTRLRTPSAPSRLRRWELALYDRMSRIQPDLVVHLVGDYAVSQMRKPGEISRDEFEKRIAVMAAMRAGAPRIHVIDAGGSIEGVSKSLFGLIWKAL